ncbi:MAG: uroporphyrinogen decarboxylase family protein [Candidatus Omnitrophota bacterium]
MNSREVFQAVTHYRKFSRLFHWEMGPYEETIHRWEKEGLPIDSGWSYYAGLDRMENVNVNTYLCPAFEYKKIKEDGAYEIYRDSDGVIKKKLKDVPPPGMPQYLDYPLKGRENWPDFKKRLNPDSPARFPLYWESIKKQYPGRDFPLGINCGSLYGWLRNWIGVEQISLLVYDDPAFLEEAAADITGCILGILEKALQGVEYDFAVLWEDMAYKTASLISPAHYRRIFLPQYRRITDRLHKAGIDIIMLDSDGNVEQLIPCWLDVGINFIYPMEVAAGMDVLALRKKFGKDLIIGGGMDKRVLALDKESIRRMVEEKIPLMQEGGYFPGCDHAIPPDVPWENFVYYRQILLNLKF